MIGRPHHHSMPCGTCGWWPMTQSAPASMSARNAATTYGGGKRDVLQTAMRDHDDHAADLLERARLRGSQRSVPAEHARAAC